MRAREVFVKTVEASAEISECWICDDDKLRVSVIVPLGFWTFRVGEKNNEYYYIDIQHMGVKSLLPKGNRRNVDPKTNFELDFSVREQREIWSVEKGNFHDCKVNINNITRMDFRYVQNLRKNKEIRMGQEGSMVNFWKDRLWIPEYKALFNLIIQLFINLSILINYVYK